jgi:hypothetical protein
MVTEEIRPPHAFAIDEDAPTEVQRPLGGVQGRPPIPAVSSTRERCAACGAALAPDQRYCVECGQRRGGATPPFSGQPSSLPGRAAAAPAQARRPPLSINATLIAGIGTLLLAMGIGILIGRSSQGSSTKTPAVQLVTSPAAASGASGSAGGSETTLPGASTTTTGATGVKSGGSGALLKPAPKKIRPPAPKAVKVGSKGSGPGYQKGKFTGNFFGEGEE